MTPVPFVRPYRPSDRAAVGDICVRTAHNGGDASALHPDPELMPTIFAYPYVDREPELARVLDDGSGRAVGYILGTADTHGFVKWFRDRWLPRVADRYPLTEYPLSDGPARTPTEEMTGLLHDPERMVRPELTGFPAHLHIDLLPSRQGQGQGRALMWAFLDALRAAGVSAVHLCMARADTGARAFYERVGFRELDVPDPGPVWYLGRSTTR
ncbi:GNAT family N-acetyltransferase [Streptomyces sp. bgisy153]|uniref:GNAT family N-acetyltransferase n=1 Tax=Streptomyces sp. bgisy153 TaxID=3413793 RepID=UPI003D708471